MLGKLKVRVVTYTIRMENLINKFKKKIEERLVILEQKYDENEKRGFDPSLADDIHDFEKHLYMDGGEINGLSSSLSIFEKLEKEYSLTNTDKNEKYIKHLEERVERLFKILDKHEDEYGDGEKWNNSEEWNFEKGHLLGKIDGFKNVIEYLKS